MVNPYEERTEEMNDVLIFAGGVGSRMGSRVPKQFLEVDGRPILIHTVQAFARHEEIDGIVIVSKAEYIDYCRELVERFAVPKVLDVIAGGESGQESIFHGLTYLHGQVSRDPAQDVVLIHDGVRPVITPELISASIACVRENGSSIAVSRAIETIIRVNAEGNVVETVDRSWCRYAKAPQCFFLEDIWQAHLRANAEHVTGVIDSATLMARYGHRLFTVECPAENIKITTPNDYYMFKAMYEAQHGKGESTDE